MHVRKLYLGRDTIMTILDARKFLEDLQPVELQLLGVCIFTFWLV